MKEIVSRGVIGLFLFLPVGEYERVVVIRVYEYMVSGLAVIDNISPYKSGLLQKEESVLLVNINNLDNVAEMIVKLINDPVLLAKMGRSGRKSFEDKYNWERQEEKFCSFYKKLIKINEEV